MCFFIPKEGLKAIQKGRLLLLKADKDIIVSKYVGCGSGNYYTPRSKSNRKILWEPGYHYIDDDENSVALDLQGRIQGGVFHSHYLGHGNPRACEVLMIIPKGSYYYYNNYKREYISKELIYPNWEVKIGRKLFINRVPKDIAHNAERVIKCIN